MTKELSDGAWAELQSAREAGVDLKADFHALPSSVVEIVLALADAAKYRHPKDANGSRGRYYFERLQRFRNRA